MTKPKVSYRWLLLVAIFLTGINLHATEKIIDSAKMPNRIFPQSEIQFIATDSGVIIRSIIDTNFPDKVFSKINQSEESNWGENADMHLYVETLQNAFTEYKKRKKAKNKQPLIVDFIASIEGDKIDFYFGPTLWKELHLSSNYIRKNQEYILQDVFGKSAKEKIKELKRLLKEKE
jgi:hypothetical protein